MVIKSIKKGSIFLIILLFIINLVNPILNVKTGHENKLFQGLYEKNGDKYDVVLLGSSHMNGSINPNVLWSEYGITSFNYGTGGQPIDVTYYLLKEVLKKHKKPIVVVDLYYLGLTDKYGQEGYIRYVLDNLRFSENKIEAIINCTPKEQWLNYLFSIIKYHSRWKEVGEKDFNNDSHDGYYTKGFGAGSNIYGKDNAADSSTKEIGEIPAKAKEYLYKIIDLSKKEDFKLIFTNAPHDYTSTAGANNWYKDPAKMFNKVEEIAKKNSIPFINYCNKLNEIGFDFKADMFNSGHMNMSGANKVTLDFGKVLKDNYSLVDHRDDKKYEEWNVEYNYYLHAQTANTLITKENIKDYIPLITNKDYVVAISCNNYNVLNNNSELKDALGKLGLKFEQYNNENNLIAVINGNIVEKELMAFSNLSSEFTLDKSTEVKTTTLSNDNNTPSIVFNGTEYSKKFAGLNIVVYDKVIKKVIDSICVDSNNNIKRRE